MFRLTRYFSLVGALVTAVAVAVIVLFYWRDQTEQHTGFIETESVRATGTLSVLLTERFPDFLAAPPASASAGSDRHGEYAAVDRLMRGLLAPNPGILKIKIYNPAGLVLYSSQREDIVASKTDSPAFLAAALEGHPVSNTRLRRSFTGFGATVLDRYVVETYVPVHGADGTLAGVFELYSDATPFVERVRKGSVMLASLAIAVLGIVFAVLLLAVRWAERVIHGQHEAIERSRTEMRIAATAFESQEGMIVTDADGTILKVNRAFTRLTGYGAEEAVGKTPALLKSGRQDRSFYERMWAVLKEKKYWQGEMWNRRKNGKIYAEWLTISAVADTDGSVTHYIGTFSEITQNKEAEAEIHRLAYYDPLTHLPNRRLLQDRLGQALLATVRNGNYGAVMFLDLDNFKTLNDTRGHDIGDQLLVEVAQRLQGCMRAGDTVARLGGDEFVVMLEDLGTEAEESAAQSKLVGEKVREVLAGPYRLQGEEFHCTTSIGISLFRDSETVEDLLKHADLAMYQAKTAGRNALRFFDPAMQTALDERSAMENDLRHALSRQQLRLYFQGQVDSDGRFVGAEALLRWQHPDRGLVAPGDFIHLAEETGLIVPIGFWVLEAACSQLVAWAANPATRELTLAINVSARQFRQPDFIEQVRQALSRAGADPARLKLELTESLVLHNVEDSAGKMLALKGLGVSFSMDDFGTGYSSLSYLTRLPLDQLKIDQSFVRNLISNPGDRVMVQTIITMARSLGLGVIAEGVETEAQRDFLLSHGCHVYQGYLFSRPLPVEEFERRCNAAG